MSYPDFWFDFEAASSLDLKAVGTFRYATDASTRAIVLAYAIGDGPALAWHADGAMLDWDNAPDDLRAVVDRGGIGAAWHASFDCNIWNYSTLGFPFMPPERVIDPMIQAGVSNLPTDLQNASRALGGAGKQKDGKRLIKLSAMLDVKALNGGLSANEAKAREVAELRLFGAGASPKKFARLAAQQVNGVLCDQYRFAGAGQTGRASSRGAQIQNLTRDVLGEDGAAEAPLVDAIAEGCDYDALVAADPVDVPAARKLALLVRPALIAGPEKVFVWSDWSAIEARITPWLAASPDAERVLDILRANDRDPTRPDIYTLTAADILHKNDPHGVTKPERNVGKVATLALGFGGGAGALKKMALNYRIHLDDDEARRIVTAWREANPWAREFWDALWDAALGAWELPGQITTAGRLAFVYRDDYLGGALFMALPSGRLLTYPRPRWREVDILDRDGKPTGEKRHELSFRRAHGRAKLWHGTICENAVQATAADLLRLTVTRIATNSALAFMPIRMTTHDEVVVEVDEARADEAKAILRREMLTLPKWAAGLPLASEESVCRWYTKSKTALSGGKS